MLYAVAEGHSNVVQVLLAAGADVEVMSDTGVTPLVAAAFQGDTEVARQLLAAGASVDPERNGGFALIYHAADAGHFGVVQLLLCSGADPWVGCSGSTILSHTAHEGHVAVVQLLVEEWGQPPPSAAALVQAARAAAGQGHMEFFAQLVKELRKVYPEELQRLCEGQGYILSAAAVAAVLKEWAQMSARKMSSGLHCLSERKLLQGSRNSCSSWWCMLLA
jgi:ankyrin repeat protein